MTESLLPPDMARGIAQGGYSKKDVQDYLFAHARIPLHEFESHTRRTVREYVEEGHLPPLFRESDDPNRLLPLYRHAEDLRVIVASNVERSRFFATHNSGGVAAARKVALPADWDKKLPGKH